jgi:sec-independent protein translocase protein TatC
MNPMPSLHKDPEAPPENRLTVAGHLEELRRRLGISLAALVAGAAAAAYWAEPIIRWLQEPLPGRQPLAYFGPAEPLMAYVKVAVLGGVALAMPVILAQVWAFARSGLTPRERGYGLAFIVWGSALFLAGAAFARYVLLPAALRVLLSIGEGVFQPMLSIDRYLSFAVNTMLYCGLAWEVPLLVWILAAVGIVTPEWLRQQRPYAILVIVIAAAVITPTTDPVTLLLMAAPMAVLYEIALVLSRLHSRRG